MMTNCKYTARPAHIAIAAMLALGTTPVLAQDASGTADAAQPAQGTSALERLAPPPATASAPAPTATTQPQIVLPETTTPAPQQSTAPVLRIDPPATTEARTSAVSTAASRTANATAPDTSRSPVASTNSRSATPATTQTSATQPAPQASDASPPNAIATEEPVDTEGATIAENAAPAAAPLATQSETATATPQSDDGLTLSEIVSLALMGLVPVGILALLLFAFMRRRTRAEAVREEEPTSVVVETASDVGTSEPYNVTPMPVSPTLAERDEIAPTASGATPAIITPVAAARLNRRDASGGLPHAGASVALPAKAPENPEEREALLRRMTEAKPDRANPFTARKARRHRAKLIIASLGRKFENGPPKMDLSQYPNNWPALARRNRLVAA